MILADTIRLALRNLGRARLRTALTTLGVSIGIASLAGMVSLGVGLEDQFVGRFTQSGVFDNITVGPPRPIVTRGAFGRGTAGRRGGAGNARGAAAPGAASPGTTPPETPAPMPQMHGVPPARDLPRPTLNDAALETLAALEHVTDVYPNIRVPLEIKFEQYSEVTSAAGVPMSARTDGAFQTFSAGAFFADDTERACLISLETARRISTRDPKDLVGQQLTLTYTAAPGAVPTADAGGPPAAAPTPTSLPAPLGLPGFPAPFQVQSVELAFRIAGIVERDPTAIPIGGFGAASVMIPLEQAKIIDRTLVRSPQALIRGAGGGAAPAERTYTAVTVRVAHAKHTEEVEDRIKALGFSAFSINDLLSRAKTAFILLDIVLGLIGSIALAVSSLGIVNTMVMSILERTKEIGIMKAIGGSDVDIRRIFLVEASVLGVFGGAAGVALGWAVGRVINAGANYYLRTQGQEAVTLFALPLWLIGGAIGFSWVVSLIAGGFPARRAARLDPIQALRHD